MILKKFFQKCHAIRKTINLTALMKSDARFVYQNNDKVLVIDLGANLGQAYDLLKLSFNGKNTTFHLFEPNPNCITHLNKELAVDNSFLKIYPKAAGIFDGKAMLFGLGANEGGLFSQGASIVQSHNSIAYSNDEEQAQEVEVIDFNKYFQSAKDNFDGIVLKMDVEGAELDLLENLIKADLLKYVDVLYVEFHSQYRCDNFAETVKERESRIIHQIKKSDVIFRIWR